MRRIVIIGGGFSGASVAMQLLRERHSEYTRIVLVDPARPGRGLAYRQDGHGFMVNVRAGSLAACEDDPHGFLHYARALGLGATADDFLPRALFGAYVEAELGRQITRAPRHVRFAFVRGEVMHLERLGTTTRYRVWLTDGRSMHAHAVVVTTGNPPPRRLVVAARLGVADGYIADPWREPAPPIAGRVLLVGTGLTMIDTALRLGTDHGTRLTAISRRGLLPHVHSGTNSVWPPTE